MGGYAVHSVTYPTQLNGEPWTAEAEDRMMEMTRSRETFQLRGRTVYVVPLPCEVADLNMLNGKRVTIDGVVGTIDGVEAYMHASPWRAGELVGITLRAGPETLPGPAVE